ncbi:MAG TPA: MFS transporter [Bacilli bacterium]|nr:MFS transporter [Bacilli bacterium]
MSASPASPSASPSLLAPLKLRSFRLLFSGQVLSDLGNWIEFFAYGQLITFVWQEGPMGQAYFLIALTLPFLLFGSVLGVLADRVDKRLALLSCDILRCLLMIAMFFADSLWPLLGLLFVKGTLSTLFNSAKQSAIRLTVPEALLLPANSLSFSSANLAKVIGPSLGALLLVVLSYHELFLLNACIYALSASLLFLLPKGELVSKPSATSAAFNKADGTDENEAANGAPAETVSRSKHPSFLTEFLEGWQVILRSKVLLAINVYFFLQCVAMYAFETQSAQIIRVVGYPGEWFAYFNSILGLGSFLVALFATKLVNSRNPFIMLFIAATALGALLLLLALGGFGHLPVTAATWLPIWFLMGGAITVMGVCYGYLLQTQSPPSHMGRVAGSTEAFVYGAILFGSLGSGFVGVRYSVVHDYLGAALLMLVAGIFALLVSPLLKHRSQTKESAVSQ